MQKKWRVPLKSLMRCVTRNRLSSVFLWGFTILKRQMGRSGCCAEIHLKKVLCLLI
jgi:hypothetical protein